MTLFDENEMDPVQLIIMYSKTWVKGHMDSEIYSRYTYMRVQ